jgi:N-hydroxyarylamine O-acetyltransferase
MATPRSAAPRTHMFLSIPAGTISDCDLILDPGFGGGAPRVPVPFDGTPAGPHRLVRDGTDHVLEQAGKRLWVSSFEHDIPIDFEMANHFTATHPASHFTQILMLRALLEDGGQVRVRNRNFTLTRGDETQTYQLADRAELRAFVAQHFGFDLPAIETLHVPAVPEWR